MKSFEISMALPCSLTELSIWILKGLAYSELAEAALEMYHTDREGFELLAKKCWDKYRAN